ncbi:hypothetical protein AVEN_236909-1 [Araneus ventricosus]|uniref:Uncharacterized protein n=1 Tax=Araneus ventricosus TaxID=182803 RepID=A0A4Y2DQG8_ARAVE|nr:hypothetical protein AVEN_236909-1 [Araneus ventricosus]
MIAAEEEICPEIANLFKTTSLSTNTVARRVDDNAENILTELSDEIRHLERFSLALVQSINVLDAAQRPVAGIQAITSCGSSCSYLLLCLESQHNWSLDLERDNHVYIMYSCQCSSCADRRTESHHAPLDSVVNKRSI